MDYNALLSVLGRDVVMARVQCATLGLGTIKGAIKRYTPPGKCWPKPNLPADRSR